MICSLAGTPYTLNRGLWPARLAKMAVSLGEQGPTLDEILLRHGLKAEDLDKQCPLEVRNEVAVKIIDWKMIGHCFNFPVETIKNIDHENRNQDQCKVALLDTWSKREGKRATYLKLADVFHRRKRRDLVEFLCAKVKSSGMRLVPVSGVPDTTWDVSTAVRSHPVSITEGIYVARYVAILAECGITGPPQFFFKYFCTCTIRPHKLEVSFSSPPASVLRLRVRVQLKYS